jgi:Ni/Fe-hydrogenase subunit HybB-like protein
MVIFEGSITHRVFHHRVGEDLQRSHDSIVRGLARICAGTLFVYLFMQLLVFVHGQKWEYLTTGWGAWYLVEIVGCVLVPSGLFLYGVARKSSRVIGTAAALTLIGIVLNRLNISVIAFKWYLPVRYVPTWQEIVVTLAVLSAEIWVFRWVVNRMPVLDSRHARTAAVELVDRAPASAA